MVQIDIAVWVSTLVYPSCLFAQPPPPPTMYLPPSLRPQRDINRHIYM